MNKVISGIRGSPTSFDFGVPGSLQAHSRVGQHQFVYCGGVSRRVLILCCGLCKGSIRDNLGRHGICIKSYKEPGVGSRVCELRLLWPWPWIVGLRAFSCEGGSVSCGCSAPWLWAAGLRGFYLVGGSVCCGCSGLGFGPLASGVFILWAGL